MARAADAKDRLDESVDAVLDAIPDAAKEVAAQLSDAASSASTTASSSPRRINFVAFLVLVGVLIAWLWSRP